MATLIGGSTALPDTPNFGEWRQLLGERDGSALGIRGDSATLGKSGIDRVASTWKSKAHLLPQPDANDTHDERIENRLDLGGVIEERSEVCNSSDDMTNRSFPTGRSCKGIHTFKAAADGILAVVRLGLLSDEGVPFTQNEIALVQRIALTVASTETFKVLSARVFQRHSIANSSGESKEEVMPIEKLCNVLDHWEIPHAHLQIFEALIRRLPSHWDCQLPSAISLADFQCALMKFLLRIRDLHSSHAVSKDQFVRRSSRNFEDDYAKGDPCGSGAFGECFWATHITTQTKRVCKQVKYPAGVPPEELPAEMDVLKRLDHPNIVRVFEWFECDGSFIFVMEAARGGDLRHLLIEAKEQKQSTTPVGIDETLSCGLMRQALRGIAYMHAQHVIHRDIKPANMLLVTGLDVMPRRPQLLLTDFGLVDLFKDDSSPISSVKGSAPYMAPEAFEGSIGPRVDVWATGVVTFEIISGQKPVKAADNVAAMYMRLKRLQISYEPMQVAQATPGAVEFVQRLLTRDVVLRPTAQAALEDPWISDDASVWEPGGKAKRNSSKSLSSYMQSSYFAKVAMNCVAAQLDASQMDGIDAAFQAMDVNYDGELSLEELSNGLKRLGVDPETAGELADALDVNHDGSIQYNEFVASLLKSQRELADKNFRHAFDVFDVDHNGSITLDELRLMLSGGGPLACVLPDGRTPDEVLAEVDTSHDGKISFQEFKAYLLQEAYCPKESGTPVDPLETIDAVLRRLTLEAGHSEAEGAACATKLADDHWITTMRDLEDLPEADWERLELPVKLERMLKRALNRG